ncbi:MAG TPA: MAPEG family protein [Stellaceae bacterium]|nr:MAPEG family protein [Stellaceae bacterium]
MIFAYWMILAAAFLPYLAIVLAKAGGGIDNHAPRRDLAALTGWRRRAEWAHRNHFEAFAPFAAAVIVAELVRGPQAWIDEVAGAFVALRILYTALYLADRAALRSLAWALGFVCVLALFLGSA